MSARGRPRQFDRDAALRTAMVLFWEHGYAATSMTMLTSAMGITSPSLYAAFGSKEELFREAIRLYTSADTSPTDAALTLPTTRAAIEAALRNNADAYVAPETPRGCMVVLAGLNLAADSEHIGNYLADFRRGDQAKIRDRVARGVAEGELPASLDSAAMASYVTTVLQGLSIQARDGRDRDALHTVIDAAMVGWDALVHRYEKRGVSGNAP